MQVAILIACTLFAAMTPGCDDGVTARTIEWSPPTPKPVSSTQPAAKGPQYLDLLEAVFRYQFDPDTERSEGQFIFLALDGSDPPPELMSRFKSRQVFPVSMSTVSNDRGVQHKNLAGEGRILEIVQIAWLDANHAQVFGGHYTSSMAAAGYRYLAERRDGKWVVTAEERLFVS